MVARHSSICSAAGGNLSSSWAHAIASVAMLGMEVDDLGRNIAWLLMVPVAAAAVVHPHYGGVATRAAGSRGDGARGSAAPSGAVVGSALPGGDTCAMTAP